MTENCRREYNPFHRHSRLGCQGPAGSVGLPQLHGGTAEPIGSPDTFDSATGTGALRLEKMTPFL
jgi:hypothetical protein